MRRDIRKRGRWHQSALLDSSFYDVVLAAKGKTDKVSIYARGILALTLAAVRALLVARKKQSARRSVLICTLGDLRVSFESYIARRPLMASRKSPFHASWPVQQTETPIRMPFDALRPDLDLYLEQRGEIFKLQSGEILLMAVFNLCDRGERHL